MSKDVVVKQSLIDTATGEVVKQKEFYVKNNFDAEKGYYFTSQKNRINIFPSNMHEELSDADIGKMFKLSKHFMCYKKYFMCPTVFFCGCWLNYNLYIMFKRDLDRILPNWVISKFNSKN